MDSKEEIEEADDDELLREYRELIEYRLEEESLGQATPRITKKLNYIEEEIRSRME